LQIPKNYTTMKKLLLCITVISLTIFSCEKSNNVNEVKLLENKVAVTLNVDEFNVEVTNFDTKATTVKNVKTSKSSGLSDKIKELYYVVYKAGKEVKRKYQFSTDENFGCLKDSLPKGDYTVIVVGSQQFFGINSGYQAGIEEEYFDSKVYFPLSIAYMEYTRSLIPSYNIDDTFFKKFTLQVTDKNITQSLKLDRIVGKLELNIEDAEKDLSVTIHDDANRFSFDKEQSTGSIFETLEDVFVVDNSVSKISVYILQTSKPITITIKSGSASKTLDVSIYKNKRTIVTGKLFPKTGLTGNFNVSVNDTWGKDYVVEF